MELLLLFSVGVSATLLLYSIFFSLKAPSHSKRVDDEVLETGSALKKSLDRLPSASAQAAQFFRVHEKERNHPWWAFKARVEERLLQSGNPKSLSADNFLDAMVYSGLLVALLFFVLSSLYGWNDVIAFFLGGVLGMTTPWLLVNQAIGLRHTQIRKSLPTMLDLLTLCVEAGMDFSTAMTRIAPKFSDTALGEELQLLLTELRMGKSRSEALRDCGTRVGLLELSTVIYAIVQSDQLGASMGPSLRIQAEDMRKRRMVLAEEMGMKAPVKLLFPLVVFIFPTTFLVIFGPMAIKMML
jgi:tight adherence protein C